MRKSSLTPVLTVLSIFLALGCTAQTMTDKAVPKKKDGRYHLKVHNQLLEIDPAKGGRITSLQLDGKDFLTDSTVNDFNWGSTFWPSPQSAWKWPPPAELDNKPYTATVENNELKMVSQQDPKTGLVVTKAFSGNKKAGSYTLKYTLTNRSDQARKVAPWEITRVRTKGITFFPTGKGERTGALLPLTVEKDGNTWFTYQAEQIPPRGNPQLYADGAEGWLAQVNEGVILVKKFPDLPLEKRAPKEGEIELYASPVIPGKSYVEIEQQGAYEELPPGASATWEVTWYLRKLPATIKPEAGNASLAAYVRKLVK